MNRVADNLAAVRERIAAACLGAGRPEDSVRLVAVTKRIPLDLVKAACHAGQLDLGENRLPEAIDRQAEVRQGLQSAGQLSDRIKWHFIGHLQSRKAAQAVGNFRLLHGVDSLKLARKLSNQCQAESLTQDILLEVNVTGEDQKHGFPLEGFGEAFGQVCAEAPALRVKGLMCMARRGDGEKEIHRTFAALRNLGRSCFGPEPHELSMGMSGDFEVAIAEGSTLVRVGTAIFGPRDP